MGYLNEKDEWESDGTVAMGKYVVPAILIAIIITGALLLKHFFW